MKILHSITDTRQLIREWKLQGARIGFVPTMGYLHEGHLALMSEACKRCDRVVTSLFVNPMQFGPNEDYDAYPRSLDRDAELAGGVGVDLVFAPAADDIYCDNYQTTVNVEKLSAGLCGADRPGHFEGVATVVTKLFNIVEPDLAVFGQKDYQQLALIRQLVSDLNFDIEIIGHPIVREDDGLAMSSRNKYLKGGERQIATCLYQALQTAREMYRSTGTQLKASEIEEMAKSTIEAQPNCKTDYAQVIHKATLAPMEFVNDDSVLVLAMKVSDKVRLIDNGFLAD